MTKGHNEAEGYAASLRQMAQWVDEANESPGHYNNVGLEDIDTEELRAAAAFIDRFTSPAATPPLATGEDKKAGWTLDFKWLETLRNEIEKAAGYDATIEVIQETVLRTLALRQSFDSTTVTPDLLAATLSYSGKEIVIDCDNFDVRDAIYDWLMHLASAVSRPDGKSP